MKTIEETIGNLVKFNILYNLSHWVGKYIPIEELMEADNFFTINEQGDADDNGDYPDIYEWWAVTESLYEDLKKHGEVILLTDSGDYIWGRTCTGQSITLDYVIQKIAIEREERTRKFINN